MTGNYSTPGLPGLADHEHATGRNFDVFLSYNSDDRDNVEKIAADLADTYGMHPWFDQWELVPGEPWMRNLERGLASARSCAVFVDRHGRGPWQNNEVAAALDRQTGNRDFRVIPVLLPGAGEPSDLPVFLRGNMLVKFGDIPDEDALWKLHCGIRGRAPGRGCAGKTEIKSSTSKPQPFLNRTDLRQPGGAIDVTSRFYIKRQADEDIFSDINRHRGLVTIRGPRQTGKSSLINRIFENLQRINSTIRPVFVDFQALTRDDLSSQNTLWCCIAGEIADQLRIEGWSTGNWDMKCSYDRNISRFLDRCVFTDTEAPLLLCLDEVDRVFKSPVMSDFFSSVRAFWNRGARDQSWKKVRWLLSTSTEPGFFIKDLTQSPFNIGGRVELNAFSRGEVGEFARRHGLDPDSSTLDRIVEHVGGQPYLVHLMLYYMATGSRSTDELLTIDTSIFIEHLSRFLRKFQQEPELAGAMKMVVDGRGCADLATVDRLQAVGLVKHDDARKVVCSCNLYRKFFGRELKRG